MARLLALAVVLLLAGCRVHVQDNDTLAHHDPELDRLDLVMRYRGIEATEPRYARTALCELDPVLAGEPVFAFWLSTIDLRELGDRLSSEDARLLSAVTVAERGLFFDERGRLSGYRHVRVEDAGATVAALNRWIDAGFHDECEGDVDPSARFARTQLRMAKAAREGWEWIALERGAIVFRIPWDPAEVGELVLELAEGLDGDGNVADDQHAFLSSFDSIQVAGGVLELRWDPAADGVIHVADGSDTEGKWDPSLQELLMETPHAALVRAAPSLEELRAMVRGD